MSKPKKPQAVADAEAAVDAKKAELAAAQGAITRIQSELSLAFGAMHKAREDADACLPQCRAVSVRWRSSKEEDAGPHAILRKTPGGTLVTRRVGGTGEFKFKWAGSRYVEAVSRKSSWLGNTLSLRDVPAEYMPATEQEAAS